MKMRIGIIGTRGVPNHYSGFEQCAEYLSTALIEKGHQVTVYNSHNHPHQEKTFKGVDIIHCYDPEYKLGTFGQFIYDLNCIIDSRKRNFDIILQLGYNSNSIWSWVLPKKPLVITNMDGLEWKRTKFSPSVQRFLRQAESWAAHTSDYLVADSLGIQQYLKDTYQKESTFIPYGAYVFNDPDASVLTEYDIKPYGYNMLVARMEPENSIEIILDGVVASKTDVPFLVVGKTNKKYGQYLVEKYKGYSQIRFVGGIYNIDKLNNVRHFSNLYFHGHTVGGTNPSLLEAMGSSGLICAHNNVFNKAILGDDAFYFNNPDDVALALKKYRKEAYSAFVKTNREKVRTIYHWPIVIDQYETLFVKALNGSRRGSAIKKAPTPVSI
jgi:glycosyltransferase involved in cell wall biosynthesis